MVIKQILVYCFLVLVTKGSAQVCTQGDINNVFQLLRETELTLEEFIDHLHALSQRVDQIEVDVNAMFSDTNTNGDDLNALKKDLIATERALQGLLNSTTKLNNNQDELDTFLNQTHQTVSVTLNVTKAGFRNELNELQQNVSDIVNGDLKGIKHDFNETKQNVRNVTNSTMPELTDNINDFVEFENQTWLNLNRTLNIKADDIRTEVYKLQDNVSEIKNSVFNVLKPDIKEVNEDLKTVQNLTIPDIYIKMSSLNETVKLDIQLLNELDIPTFVSDLNATKQSSQTNNEALSAVNGTVRNNAQSIDMDIQVLKINVTKTNRELDQFEQTSESNFTDMKNNMNLVNEALNRVSQSTGNDINVIRTTYDRLEIKNGSLVRAPRAFFLAQSPATNTASESGIVYKNVSYNIGNGYNSTTGRFTAIATGLYAFTYQVCGQRPFTGHYGLARNTAQLFLSGQYVAYFESCVSSSAFVELHAMDQVWVKHVEGGSTQLSNSIFSGALLFSFF